MPSLRARIKKLAYQKIISDKDKDRIINALDVAEQESKTDTWSIKEVADVLEKHGLLEQKPKTKCNYCHTDSDECIEPMDRNAHVFLYPISGIWKLHIKLKGEHRKYDINYCPICGRKLSEFPTDSESEVSE